MKKLKVLILTDSLGLPRTSPENLAYEDTWCYSLKDKYDVLQISIGGGVIGEIYKQCQYYKGFKPDIVIIQMGIVDCAPRILGKTENLLLNSNPVTRKILSKILPRYGKKIREYRKKTYTSTYHFEEYLKKIIETFQNSIFYSIGIMPASAQYEADLIGISENIDQYNSILKKIFKDLFIDTLDFTEKDLMSDYHHLNSIGHKKIIEKLKLKINI